MYTGPKRPKLVWPEGRRRIPLVVARQVDVLPAQRRQMGKISGRRMVPLLSKVIDSPLQIGRVPQNDGGDEQIQTARAVALILIRAVADFAESVEEHGAAKRILLLTLVETDVAATTQFRVLQPLQCK